MVRDDQPDGREGQAGRPEVAERFALPLKPGNAGGGKRPTRLAALAALGTLLASFTGSALVERLEKHAVEDRLSFGTMADPPEASGNPVEENEDDAEPVSLAERVNEPAIVRLVQRGIRYSEAFP